MLLFSDDYVLIWVIDRHGCVGRMGVCLLSDFRRPLACIIFMPVCKYTKPYVGHANQSNCARTTSEFIYRSLINDMIACSLAI